MNARELNLAVMDAQIALEALREFNIERVEYECLHETLRNLLPEFKLAAERYPTHPVYGSIVEQIEAQVRPERYRYEAFVETDGYKAGGTSWLIFDRQSVGCMTKLDSEREAAIIVAALNAFTLTEDANAFQPEAWHDAAREARIAEETRIRVKMETNPDGTLARDVPRGTAR